MTAANGHRPELVPLIGRRVIVTTGTGGTWSVTLVGLMDRPSMVLRLDDGRKVSLPQALEITAAPPAPAEQIRALLPDLDELADAVRAMGTTGEDTGTLRRVAGLRTRIRQIAEADSPPAPDGQQGQET